MWLPCQLVRGNQATCWHSAPCPFPHILSPLPSFFLRNWTLGPRPPLLVHVSSSLYPSFSLCYAFPFWDPTKPTFPPAHPRPCQHTFNWRTESQIIVSLKPGPAVATTVISPYLPSSIGNLHGKSPPPRLVEEWEGRFSLHVTGSLSTSSRGR